MPTRKSASQQSSMFSPDDRAPAGAWVTAHIDGGARGNPGPAGFGVILTDASGKVLAEISEFLGIRTNNVAEYSALIAALERATQDGHRRLRVVSDSELLVKQMKGQYKVSSPDLKPLYDRAKALVRQLDRFMTEHVRREHNKRADQLANLAMDRGLGKSPAAAAGRPSAAPAKDYLGIVRDGLVEFFGDPPPEGTRVRVRKA